jgi:hypothetical protein
MRDVLAGTATVGPLLFCHGHSDAGLQLAALVAQPSGPASTLEANGAAVAPRLLQQRLGYDLLRYDFTLAAGADTGYRFRGAWYPVGTDLGGDLRIAYVACNGQEHADRERLTEERNLLWRRLGAQVEERGVHLLLHGGDQLYADEMLEIDPALLAWRGGRPAGIGSAPPPDLEDRLGDYLFRRYLEAYAQPAVARVMARVPSLAIWDDHDICDGWGSRPVEQLDAPLGRLVFRVAREQYLLFQMAATAAAPPPICPDGSGATLSWHVDLPGLRIVAPDLRSERRPDRVMTGHGWRVFREQLSTAATERVLVLSSVPALGPRLSLVEAILHLIPHAQKYEDDLRDQWQSRAHRDEWRAFLTALLDAHERSGQRVTVLSGEIHLATRGTLSSNTGELHQLVASGITHPPPPRAYARALGALARFGESPLADRRITLTSLPGQRTTYTAQRNYLLLERGAGAWSARWELEDDGPTPALNLD